MSLLGALWLPIVLSALLVFVVSAIIHMMLKYHNRRNHVAYDPPILIDARLKPGFPAELFCDERTDAQVTRRWNEYFPARRVEMGDSARADLDRA